MFSEIKIERFRGIRYGSIGGFKQINLFFGKNNSGKSTLLESIFLASGLSNPLLPLHTNMMRGYGKTTRDDLKLHFYQLDPTNPIHIQMVNDEVRNLNISMYTQYQNTISLGTADVPNLLSNTGDGNYGLLFDFEINGNHFESQLNFDYTHNNEVTRKVSNKYTETLHCTYLNPKYDFQASMQGLHNILQNKDERFIIEGLQIIEPSVRNFIFADNEMLVDIGMERRIPVNMLGDGARKIVSLLTAVYNCKDGILLVDELSNGFHYSVMGSLWKVLIHACLKNNTQLFVTTHDVDSIRGLRTIALGKYDDKVATFKLLKTSNCELEALHYSLESLNYSLNQEIEVR